MSKNRPTTSPETDWLELQKLYLDACRVFNQFMPGQGSAAGFKSPLADMLEQWGRSVTPTIPTGNADFLNKILEQGRIYYFLGEQFIKIMNEANKAGNAGQGWENILNRHFEEIKSSFGKIQNDAKVAAHRMAGAWQLMPMDTLQRTLALGSVMPGDFLGPLKHEDIRQMSEKFLSIPGVGYTRESQEQLQEGVRLWNEYQKVSQEYHQALYKVGIEAIDAMQRKILAMSRTGEELKSLREVYDLWVDCNEEAYAAFAYTPEYSRLYGRLTNALMAVKQHGRNFVDESLGALNVPTYKGINTLQKRQYEMARQQKDALKKIQDLQEEINHLRNLQVQPAPVKKAVPSAVPAAVYKPVKATGAKSAKSKTAGVKAAPLKKRKKKRARNDGMLVIKI